MCTLCNCFFFIFFIICSHQRQQSAVVTYFIQMRYGLACASSTRFTYSVTLVPCHSPNFYNNIRCDRLTACVTFAFKFYWNALHTNRHSTQWVSTANENEERTNEKRRKKKKKIVWTNAKWTKTLMKWSETVVKRIFTYCSDEEINLKTLMLIRLDFDDVIHSSNRHKKRSHTRIIDT